MLKDSIVKERIEELREEPMHGQFFCSPENLLLIKKQIVLGQERWAHRRNWKLGQGSSEPDTQYQLPSTQDFKAAYRWQL